jgi:putative ABC transport system permease protein
MSLSLDSLVLDAKHGVRQLARAPLVTGVAVVTLAIGIGLNTAVFSLVHAVLLRPLPYPAAERLVWIAPFSEQFSTDTWGSRGDYAIWRQQGQLFDGMTAYGTADLNLVVAGQASQERIASIGGDFWALTGARATLGRLTSEHDEVGLVLSHGLFQRRFGGDAAAIGRGVTIGGAPFTIVGVLPDAYRVTFPQQTAPGDELRDLDAFIALPAGQEPPGRVITQTSRPAPAWIRVVGRLRPGVGVDVARTEMQALHARLEREYPRPAALQRSLRLMPLKDKLAEQVRLSLLVLQGAVAFVLLIAVANVANLMLEQASRRTRETAIRAALGAGRRRLLIQFLVESVVLALIAGGAAVLVAYAAVPLLVSLAPFAMTSVADVAVDGPVLRFTLLLSLATALLFAWAPVLQTSRVSLLDTLAGTAPSAMSGRSRAQGLLISLEVALAILLLTAAGLMMKSLWRLQEHTAGFAPAGSYTMRIPLTGPRYTDLGNTYAYIHQLLERLEGTSGVEAAGIAASTYQLPIAVGGVTGSDPATRPSVAVRMVSPGYLRAMGVSLVRGRWPTKADALDSMVVNETFARTVVPNGDPIGRTIGGTFLSGTIVGVVHDFAFARLDGESTPELYYPWQRAPATRSIAVAVRMPASLVSVVRESVEQLDRTQPVYQFQSLEQALAESVAPRRFNMFLLQVYAASAALMALAGTFGVVARSVSRRTRETAVRIAVGARPAAVVRLIVRRAMVYVLLGLGAGILATLALGRVMRGLLHGVEPTDPATIAVMAVSLTGAALVACAVPAARAARVDPVVALRQE